MDDEASKKDQITKIEGTRESTGTLPPTSDLCVILALPPLLRTEATRESTGTLPLSFRPRMILYLTALPPRQSVTMSVKQ